MNNTEDTNRAVNDTNAGVTSDVSHSNMDIEGMLCDNTMLCDLRDPLQIQYTSDNSNLQGTDENGSSKRMFELSGVNYEEVLEQGDSILVRVIASSSYRGFELSGLYCIKIVKNEIL